MRRFVWISRVPGRYEHEPCTSMQNVDEQPRAPSRSTCLAIALLVTLAARAVPEWQYLLWISADLHGGHLSAESAVLCQDLVLLLLSATLCLCAPRESGLRLGAIREHWRGVLLVCGGPIVLAAIVYPNLPERPFTNARFSMWTISPLAQELLFSGFLYGYLARAFPGYVGALPLSKTLVLTAILFALWHVPNFGRGSMSAGYVAFQLCYTGLGALVGGLARQWTGSMLYGLVTHCVNNAIAAYFS